MNSTIVKQVIRKHHSTRRKQLRTYTHTGMWALYFWWQIHHMKWSIHHIKVMITASLPDYQRPWCSVHFHLVIRSDLSLDIMTPWRGPLCLHMLQTLVPILTILLGSWSNLSAATKPSDQSCWMYGKGWGRHVCLFTAFKVQGSEMWGKSLTLNSLSIYI